MNNKPKTKLLTIGLLCCGRVETTKRCLDSLMPIREAIDSEIQIVDTGCGPETRALIEQYADEIFEFEWCNDFAKARNFQLDQANGEMFLFIDDDEFFIDPKYIIDYFKQKNCLDYNIGGYYQRNYLDFDGIEYQDIEVIRMCRVTPETVFIGKVHEYIEPSYGNAIFLDARAGHFGYIYKDPEDNIKHAMRNIPLLKEMMEEQPDNLRWPYQLAQEYRAIDKYDELIELCEYGIKKSYEIEKNDSIRYRATFVCGLTGALLDLNRWDELIQIYHEQMAKDEIMEVPKAKICLQAARVFFLSDMNEECIEACSYYIRMYDKYNHERGMIFLQAGIFISNVFEQRYLDAVYCYLMTCGIKKNNFTYLVRYYRRLSWNDPVIHLQRGFIIALIMKGAEFGHKKEITDVLNKFFIRPGARDALEHEIDLSSEELKTEELKNLREAFRNTSREKEIRLFIEILIMEQEVVQIKDFDSLSECLDIALHYANITEEWRLLHLQWPNDEVDLETNAEPYLLGQAFKDFVLQKDENATAALKIIKDAIGLRPRMDNLISQLALLFNQFHKVEIAKKEDPEKFEEMYRLEETILKQVMQLDNAGKTDEAVAVYQQLTDILEKTYGVSTLHV